MDGEEVDPVDYMKRLAATNPEYFARPGQQNQNTTKSPTSVVQSGMDNTRLARADGRRRAVEQALARGNPWQESSWNRTAQGILSNLAPELATELKRESHDV